MAEVIRKAVDAKIREGVSEVPWEERVRRAMAVMGKFHSGYKDVSRRHDHYLAEAFDEPSTGGSPSHNFETVP